MAITNFEFRDNENIVSWNYEGNNIIIRKKEIDNTMYYEQEKLMLILFEENSLYSTLIGVNEDGTIRFSLVSTEDKGISYLALHPDIKIAAVGWEKEKDTWIDYYYSIDPQNGEMNKHFRAC